MSDKWLTPQQVAEILGCSVRTVRAMLRDGLLSGEKAEGQWRVKAGEVERIQSVDPSVPVPEPPASSSLLEVQPGMVEVSLALSGIAAAIAAILPSISIMTEDLRFFVALFAGFLAVFSAYSALWLLARYCCVEKGSLLGFKEIFALLTSPVRNGPYWFLGLGLFAWLVLSVLIGALAGGRFEVVS